MFQFLGEVPKQRTDLLPHYARLIATLNPYMPDVGAGILEIVSSEIDNYLECMCVCVSKAEAKGLQLDEELRYLQRKKLVRELDSTRLKVNALFFQYFPTRMVN